MTAYTPTQPLLLTAASGAPPGEGAPPGAPPEGAPFASALNAEQARTAVAEGQQQEERRSDRENACGALALTTLAMHGSATGASATHPASADGTDGHKPSIALSGIASSEDASGVPGDGGGAAGLQPAGEARSTQSAAASALASLADNQLAGSGSPVSAGTRSIVAGSDSAGGAGATGDAAGSAGATGDAAGGAGATGGAAGSAGATGGAAGSAGATGGAAGSAGATGGAAGSAGATGDAAGGAGATDAAAATPAGSALASLDPAGLGHGDSGTESAALVGTRGAGGLPRIDPAGKVPAAVDSAGGQQGGIDPGGQQGAIDPAGGRQGAIDPAGEARTLVDQARAGAPAVSATSSPGSTAGLPAAGTGPEQYGPAAQHAGSATQATGRGAGQAGSTSRAAVDFGHAAAHPPQSAQANSRSASALDQARLGQVGARQADSRSASGSEWGLSSASALGGEAGPGSAAGLAQGVVATSAAQDSAASVGDPQAPLLGTGIGLQQALEELTGTIELAARQGLTQARIALEPAELGEIRIHLVQTPNGLLARVTAGAQSVAQALAGGHAELRQSLTSLGIDLVGLELGHHGQAASHGGGATAEHGRDGATRGQSSPRAPRMAATDAGEPAADAPADQQLPPPLPVHGALLDVLA